jgi:uncharacterized protein involved in exopolysaccharide biosynthesis
MGSLFNTIDLLKILLKWKWHLLSISIVSVILATIFSGPNFIKPQYKSYAILYPANLVPYGTESTTEQMLQLFESKDVRSKLIKKFNLMRHFEVDSTQPYPITELNERMDEKISFNKTEYQSVEVVVYDQDPDTAALIANAIVELLNEKAQALQRDKYFEVVKISKDVWDKKKIEVDSMELAIKNLRVNYGIINYDAQSKVITKEYLQALSRNGAGVKQIEPILKNLQEKGGEFIALNENLWRARGAYNDLKTQYENVLKDYEKELTYSNIVTKAFPAEKKSYPVRWLIVAISFIASLFFSLIILLILESSQNMPRKFN